jgi:histidine triad (HIT) family protein
MDDCLFCKFIKKELNTQVVYEDAQVLAFRDINPQAPVHILIVPKKHIASINEINDGDAELMGLMMTAARDLAKKEGISEAGFRCVFNTNNAAGQAVKHIHLHLMGGRNFSWPPG